MQKERPNIIFIITDQQRFDTICAAGYDRLGAVSVPAAFPRDRGARLQR